MIDMPAKRWIWILLGFIVLLCVYLLTRLTNLTAMPIFTDEAIYIRWSQIGMRDANWRFISLTDGKQPMFTWITMILLKMFSRFDPLFVGRLTSVIAGAATMIGVWMLTRELFREKRVAWMASILYLLLPFTVWYDRVALYDSLVSTFSVWSLYLGVLLAKNVRLDTALLLGLAMGAGMLNKSSAFLTLYFLPVTLLVLDWKSRHIFRRLLQWFGLAIVAAVLSQMEYSILRLSPFFHMVGQKDNVFIFTVGEWMNQPFRFLAGNLRGMFDWLRQYMTLPLFLLVFVPFFSRWKHHRERLLLYLWWALPFGALANFAKILYPRFILFMTIPLIILAAYGFDMLWRSITRPLGRLLLILVFVVPSVYISSYIVLRPMNAPIPLADRGQFLDNWAAGGGVKEVVSLLKAEAAGHKISVYTEGTFGLMPYSLEIYLVDNPNVKITGIWPLPILFPDEMKKDASLVPTYFIMNQTQIMPPQWPLSLIGEYVKGNGIEQSSLRFYRVNASSVPAL